MAFLDDLPFAQTSLAASMHQARMMLHELEAFGWLINTDKCVGLHKAVQTFKSLGTQVDLVLQHYSMTAETMARIRAKALALFAVRGPCPSRLVASVKGLIASTWVSTGSAASLRTSALGWVVESRTGRGRASWSRAVTLSIAAVSELQWWTTILEAVNGQDIIPNLTSGFFDGKGICDASSCL
jgi:hypothetical protein